MPTVKLAHDPTGLPKLAKTTSWMVFFGGQVKIPRVLWSSAMSLIWPPSLSHVFICAGLCSEMNTQMSSLLTVWMSMPSGLPSSSSNTTNRLFLDFKNDRGIWYLKGKLISSRVKVHCRPTKEWVVQQRRTSIHSLGRDSASSSI